MPAKPQALADAAEAGFPGLELEPLAVAPPDTDEPPSEPQAAVAADAMPDEQGAEETPEEMAPAATSTVDDRAAEPLAEAPSTATAAIESAAEADPIALQVDQDLDELATDAPDRSPGDEAAQSPAAPVAATTEREQAPYPQLVTPPRARTSRRSSCSKRRPARCRYRPWSPAHRRLARNFPIRWPRSKANCSAAHGHPPTRLRVRRKHPSPPNPCGHRRRKARSPRSWR